MRVYEKLILIKTAERIFLVLMIGLAAILALDVLRLVLIFMGRLK